MGLASHVRDGLVIVAMAKPRPRGRSAYQLSNSGGMGESGRLGERNSKMPCLFPVPCVIMNNFWCQGKPSSKNLPR